MPEDNGRNSGASGDPGFRSHKVGSEGLCGLETPRIPLRHERAVLVGTAPQEKPRTARAPGCLRLSPGSRNVYDVVTHEQAATPERLLPVHQEGEAPQGIPERKPHPGVGRRALRTHVGAPKPSGCQLGSPWITPWNGQPALTRGTFGAAAEPVHGGFLRLRRPHGRRLIPLVGTRRPGVPARRP
ncbi:hypothetical protein AB0D78_37115 [Streptomyces avermitilis]|uniref:hypothetical protein n=1 Tax=Streptomyces avermitilis TaxID=33903 RepID=UPI0033C53196